MISVLFSTFNGNSTLKLMLDSLAAQDLPADFQWEIIAVDNNSTDSTTSIIQSYRDKLPICLLHEERQGKNIALNRGLKRCNGDLIALTDDDVIFHPTWLFSLFSLASENENYDIFGGSVLPFWQVPPPDKLLRSIPILVAYALTTDDNIYIDGEISPTSLLGPNMAVKRHVFDSIYFNENIGPAGNNYVMGSETDFLYRAGLAGFKAIYDKSVTVRHIIRPFQFDQSWLDNRAFKAGRALFHEQVRDNEIVNVSTLLGYPRWALTKILKLWFLLQTKRFTIFGETQYKVSWELFFLKGYAFEFKSNEKLN
jgi:glycosyltransferase involved in cell wall biosynthesis